MRSENQKQEQMRGKKLKYKFRIWRKKMTTNKHPGIFRSPVANNEISFGFFILQTRGVDSIMAEVKVTRSHLS